MSWWEKIIAAHRQVTDQVSHGDRMKSERYFVWQADGEADCILDGRHAEKAVTGSTDLFTKQEFDPWKDQMEQAFDNAPDILWRLNSIQFEEDTGFWHYEWLWTVV